MLPCCALQLDRDEDRARFTRLYKSHQRPLHRMAARILGPGPRAEDAVHDAFIKLIQNFTSLRTRSDAQLERWLMVVLRNTALDMLRKEGRETELESQPWEPAIPPDQGEFEALVMLDIAGELGLTEGAAKSRLFRGRKLLIDMLRREGYLDGRSCV